MMETTSAVQIQANGRRGVVPRAARRSAAFPLIVLGAAFAYALLRYVVFGDTALSQVPLYVTNKAVAAGAVIFLLAAAVACMRGNKDASKRWGRWALHTAAIHATASIILLADVTYPKLFGPDQLSWSGEASMMAAVAALYCFFMIGRRKGRGQITAALLASGFAAAHLGFYGFAGWFDASSWPGGLPPITLWSFLIACGAVAAYAIAARNAIPSENIHP